MGIEKKVKVGDKCICECCSAEFEARLDEYGNIESTYCIWCVDDWTGSNLLGG
jgi:hypothetical protein